MESTREKREFERFAIKTSVHVIRTDMHSHAITYSADLSEGGLAFYSESQLNEQEPLTLSISVENQVFKIRARVAYSRQSEESSLYRTGIFFEDSESAFKAKLAEELILIKKHQRDHSENTSEDSQEKEALNWIHHNAAYFNEMIRKA